MSIQNEWLSVLDIRLLVICEVCPDQYCISEGSGNTIEGDECHQLRMKFAHLTETVGRTFIPGWELSFDKNRNPSRLWNNPVRQYNSSKMDKYQINFFI